jgi:hypothetical protein
MQIHKQNIHKHAKVIKSNHIDNKLKDTESLVKKIMGLKDGPKERLPLHMKKEQ